MAGLGPRLSHWLWEIRRHRRAWVIGGVVVLLAGATVLGARSFRDAPTDAVTNTATSARTGTAERFLDGVAVDPGVANELPIAVSIDNLVSVRPQRGLGSAKVVTEALAEGGITRFLAVFDGTEGLAAIGPVRSARPYFVDWASELGALFVHAGGSPEALARIPREPLHDLDQISGDHPYFWRDDGLEPPHNLFTSSELLAFAKRDRSLPTHGSFTPWIFTTDAPLADRPASQPPVTIDFSTFSYLVQWDYDRPTNRYRRSQAGEPHLDAASQRQIEAATVVVQVIPTRLSDDGIRLDVSTVGQGRSWYYQNGSRTEGTWEKKASNARTVFLDSQGDPFRFIAGPTWVEAVTEQTTVTDGSST